MDRDLPALVVRQRILRNHQRAACAAGPVADEIGGRLHLVGDRLENENRHKLDHIAKAGFVRCYSYIVFRGAGRRLRLSVVVS